MPRGAAGHQAGRQRRLGTPCRVRLDIYLVGYGGRKGGSEEEERAEREREIGEEAVNLGLNGCGTWWLRNLSQQLPFQERDGKDRESSDWTWQK